MKVQATQNNSKAFKAWIKLSGNTSVLSKKDINKIEKLAKKIGDERDLIDVHISDIVRSRDNSWSEMRCRYTVPEVVRESYMSAIVNGEHFNKKIETLNNNDFEIGFGIINWLKTLPAYKNEQ